MVKDFVNGRHTPNRTNMMAIIGAVEKASVEFTIGTQLGVRLKLPLAVCAPIGGNSKE